MGSGYDSIERRDESPPSSDFEMSFSLLSASSSPPFIERLAALSNAPSPYSTELSASPAVTTDYRLTLLTIPQNNTSEDLDDQDYQM